VFDPREALALLVPDGLALSSWSWIIVAPEHRVLGRMGRAAMGPAVAGGGGGIGSRRRLGAVAVLTMVGMRLGG
jgi:hypothetical protein